MNIQKMLKKMPSHPSENKLTMEQKRIQLRNEIILRAAFSQPTIGRGNQHLTEDEENLPKQEEEEDFMKKMNSTNSRTLPLSKKYKRNLKSDPDEVKFFSFLHSELKKADQFYVRIEEEYRQRVAFLYRGSRIVVGDGGGCFMTEDDRTLDPQSSARAAFSTHKDLALLETYAIMNFCAFSKILKKHDKYTGRSTRQAFMTKLVHQSHFYDTSRLMYLLRASQIKFQEASSRWLKKDWNRLQEDERLFVTAVSRLVGKRKKRSRKSKGRNRNERQQKRTKLVR